MEADPSCTLFETRAASMLTDAISFTITPTFTPCLFCKICCRRVVLPAPRNPANTEIGVSRGMSGNFDWRYYGNKRCFKPKLMQSSDEF
eukprot:2373361-Pyramimonas_sp.AAC.1